MTIDALLTFLENEGSSYRITSIPGACKLTIWPVNDATPSYFQAASLAEICMEAEWMLFPDNTVPVILEAPL